LTSLDVAIGPLSCGLTHARNGWGDTAIGAHEPMRNSGSKHADSASPAAANITKV
jgi:hypothetical protein